MITDVEAALAAILGNVPNLRHANGAGRIFELFVMTKIGRELQASGFDVWLQRSDESRVSPSDSDRRFIQRGGAPAGLARQADGPNNASVIGFRWGLGPSWEIWNGVQFRGRSHAEHELDIAIVPASVGVAVRAPCGDGIPVGRPRVAIECKDVGAAGSLDEIRTLVARLYDLTLLGIHHWYLPFSVVRAIHPGSPQGPRHGATRTFWQENRRTKNILARRTGFARGTVALTTHYRIEPYENVTVSNANARDLARSVVGYAMNRLR